MPRFIVCWVDFLKYALRCRLVRLVVDTICTLSLHVEHFPRATPFLLSGRARQPLQMLMPFVRALARTAI